MSSNIPPPPSRPPEFPGPGRPDEPNRPEEPAPEPTGTGATSAGATSAGATSADYASSGVAHEEPTPFPTTSKPKGPRQPGREPRASRRTLIIAAVIVLVLLAGGSGWAIGTFGGDGDGHAEAASPATTSSTESAGETPTTSSKAPKPTTTPKSASAKLRKVVKDDRATAKSELNNKWVPQVGSKRTGMKVGDTTWTNKKIWRSFEKTKDKYPDALLLRSEDWKSFRLSNFWVTVINKPYDNPDDALDWCRSHHLDGEHCYAKRISNSHGPDSSSKH
ncbi:flagellar basal body-associated FliL family protein [Spelaeicoccus albus]|uniref:Uncharacterized protein n=1 Tax=Spelaeicoccus albus TaxID=1280376 RepID=A0A7Z0A8J1_9MICO|nr:hypothetical protein [Spelaeicoccus albus]NYI66382.1 hypothetical protein [Spelaeicoccus albus]